MYRVDLTQWNITEVSVDEGSEGSPDLVKTYGEALKRLAVEAKRQLTASHESLRAAEMQLECAKNEATEAVKVFARVMQLTRAQSDQFAAAAAASAEA